MRTLRITALFAAAAFVACQKAETPEQMAARRRAESDSAMTAITALAAAYGQHFSAGHADSVAAMYAADANLMAPNMPTVRGRDSIRTALQQFFTQMHGATLVIRPQHVSAEGNGAVDLGRWVMTGPGMPADSGKYLATWTRKDGSWRMVNDIWNSDLPPMPMAAAAPARHH